MALQAALAAFREGQHDVLTKFVAKYEGESLDFAKGLQVNNSIRSINLRANDIGDEGATAIGLALQVNTSLATLILYNNKIGDAGATAIAKALQVNKALVEFDIRGNKIGPAAAIANMLKTCCCSTLPLAATAASPAFKHFFSAASPASNFFSGFCSTLKTGFCSTLPQDSTAASPASKFYSGCCSTLPQDATAASPASNSFSAASTASKFYSDRIHAKTGRISSPRDLHQICSKFGTEKTAAKTGKFSSSKSCKKCQEFAAVGRANGGRGGGEGVKRGEGNGHVTQRGGRVKGGEEGSWVE
eukprot:g42684.t1